MVIACVDVHYEDKKGARAALVAVDRWDEPTARERRLVIVPDVAPYEPGSFFKRELPCILAVIGALGNVPDIVLVDGHAWLDGNRPGLGARLLDAEPRIKTVVGVAKTLFKGSKATPVLRGKSGTPLYVDEAGEHVDAPARIAEMAGSSRIPTLLGLVDALARGRKLGW